LRKVFSPFQAVVTDLLAGHDLSLQGGGDQLLRNFSSDWIRPSLRRNDRSAPKLPVPIAESLRTISEDEPPLIARQSESTASRSPFPNSLAVLIDGYPANGPVRHLLRTGRVRHVYFRIPFCGEKSKTAVAQRTPGLFPRCGIPSSLSDVYSVEDFMLSKDGLG